MNDSNPHGIREELGYSRPLMLSIGIHILLAGLLWAGAAMHQAPDARVAPMGKHSSSALQPSVPLTYGSPVASPMDANPASTQARTDRVGARTAKVTQSSKGGDSLTATQKTLAAVTPTRKPNRQSLPESSKHSERRHKKAEPTAVARGEIPSAKNKVLAKTDRKTEAVSSRRIAKTESNRRPRKDLVKRSADKPDLAEIKKLESMREAELRRISRGVS
jgi:hypothetical protein